MANTILISSKAKQYLRELSKNSPKATYSTLIDELVVRDKRNKQQRVHRRKLRGV